MELLIIIVCIIIILAICLWIKLEGRLWPHQSTQAFWHLSNLPLGKKLEGYFYAARPDWYLKPVTWPWFMKRFVKNESPDTYHGKMMIRADAVKLITINQPIAIHDLEQVVPYPLARSIILLDPLPSLAVMECPCRAQKKDACQPHDVCLVMGEPFTSFIVDHQPEKARRITVEEALQIIAAEEERGHIHTAWFKDVMHNRFYTICNCCSCCCLGMGSMSRGVERLAHSGYSPCMDLDRCVMCENCASICPFTAISVADAVPEFNMEKCMGCGLCVSHCPVEAITLNLSPQLGTPLNIEQMV
jgi:formate hydrogenlyase subunit 6/NADH:ubiquinone oxidoreductase subunit I